MHNLFTLLEPNGTIIISALGKASKYQVGNQFFPSAQLEKDDLWNLFIEYGFDSKKLDIHEEQVSEWISEGFSSILIAIAQKKS